MSIFSADKGGSLLETCPCLLEFISAVVTNNTATDPGVLSFTLKLTGLIAAKEDNFKMLQVDLLTHYTLNELLLASPDCCDAPPQQECSVLDLVFNLQHWQEAGLWEDPCLRIGWIQGLNNLLQHPKALSFFVQSGDTSSRKRNHLS